MTLNFLFLVLAALVFRYLAFQANTAFVERLTRLLERNPSRRRLVAALKDHPERLAEFRARVLPLAARQLGLDSASCILLILAIYVFPPSVIGVHDLANLQWTSVVVVSLAMLVEGFWFVRTCVAALRAMPVQPE
jgi:hypothetical protein